MEETIWTQTMCCHRVYVLDGVFAVSVCHRIAQKRNARKLRKCCATHWLLWMQSSLVRNSLSSTLFPFGLNPHVDIFLKAPRSHSRAEFRYSLEQQSWFGREHCNQIRIKASPLGRRVCLNLGSSWEVCAHNGSSSCLNIEPRFSHSHQWAILTSISNFW